MGGFGNTLVSGGSFGDALKAGFIGGGIAAVTAGFLGGIERGLLDLSKEYSFWNGSQITEAPVTGNVSGTDMSQYKENAKKYNSEGMKSTRETNDAILKGNVKDATGFQEGDLRIEKITTAVHTRKYGLTADGAYVNLETGNVVPGHTLKYSTGKTNVHISSRYMSNTAVIKHEMIHAYHHYAVPNFEAKFSERYVYQQTYQSYINNGQYIEAARTMFGAMSIGYWGSYPDIYKIPMVYRLSIP